MYICIRCHIHQRGNLRLTGLCLEKEKVIRAVCNASFSEIQTKADRIHRTARESGYLPIFSGGIEGRR